MEKRIIFATGNAGKMREIREILKDMGLEILSMKEAGIQADIVEDGRTIISNVVATQIPFHQQFNGVVPEIASRKHAEWIMPVVQQVSQATRPIGSWARISSSTASEIWSQILSGCPSVTDSEVKR